MPDANQHQAAESDKPILTLAEFESSAKEAESAAPQVVSDIENENCGGDDSDAETEWARLYAGPPPPINGYSSRESTSLLE